MQTIHINGAAIAIPHGSRVMLTPYVEGEPMVTYVTDTASLAVPRRAVAGGEHFLALQLASGTADVVTVGEEITVRLADHPMFKDTLALSLVLGFLNRTLAGPATLRTAGLSLTEPQWASLTELERFIFYGTDQNPYWTGRTGQDFSANGIVSKDFVFRPAFSVHITPSRLTVAGPNGFALQVDLQRLTNPPTRPVSLLAGRHMEFPFPCDFKDSFFIPHTAIRCVIEQKRTVCEGVLHSDGRLRIEPIDARAFMWFHFEISPRHD